MFRIARVTAVLAFAMALTPGSAVAREWKVENFGDASPSAPSRDAGPEKPLRWIVRHASRGDVIKFDRPGVVELNFALNIPSDLEDLTIDGRVGDARAGIRFLPT